MGTAQTQTKARSRLPLRRLVLSLYRNHNHEKNGAHPDGIRSFPSPSVQGTVARAPCVPVARSTTEMPYNRLPHRGARPVVHLSVVASLAEESGKSRPDPRGHPGTGDGSRKHVPQTDGSALDRARKPAVFGRGDKTTDSHRRILRGGKSGPDSLSPRELLYQERRVFRPAAGRHRPFSHRSEFPL